MSQLFTSGGQNVGALASATSPSNDYSGLISFRFEWLDLLEVQGTLKSLLQHHNSKASIFGANFHYGPNLTSIHGYWKNHSIDYMDLRQLSNVCAFNMLFRFVITFLPWSKCLLISWLQSLFQVILEPKKIKSVTASTFSHLFAMKRWDQIPWS